MAVGVVAVRVWGTGYIIPVVDSAASNKRGQEINVDISVNMFVGSAVDGTVGGVAWSA